MLRRSENLGGKSHWRLILLTGIALFATIPWFASPTGDESPPDLIFGLPMWAFYSILATTIYAAIVSFSWHRVWGSEDSEADESP